MVSRELVAAWGILSEIWDFPLPPINTQKVPRAGPGREH